jgi:hypothetical protein
MAPFIRIFIRYAAGALIAKGYFSPGDVNLFMDPELIGAIVGILNEGWYYAARRFGWAK